MGTPGHIANDVDTGLPHLGYHRGLPNLQLRIVAGTNRIGGSP
jgi:hypothetical protein